MTVGTAPLSSFDARRSDSKGDDEGGGGGGGGGLVALGLLCADYGSSGSDDDGDSDVEMGGSPLEMRADGLSVAEEGKRPPTPMSAVNDGAAPPLAKRPRPLERDVDDDGDGGNANSEKDAAVAKNMVVDGGVDGAEACIAEHAGSPGGERATTPSSGWRGEDDAGSAAAAAAATSSAAAAATSNAAADAAATTAASDASAAAPAGTSAARKLADNERVPAVNERRLLAALVFLAARHAAAGRRP